MHSLLSDTLSIIRTFLDLKPNNIEPFRLSYEMENLKICKQIMIWKKDDIRYIGICEKIILSEFFDLDKKLIEEKDEYDNNIELIKLLIKSEQNDTCDNIQCMRQILQICIQLGRLDIIKLCYKHFKIYDSPIYLLNSFYNGHTHIIKWMYYRDPLKFKSYFKILFSLVNIDIINEFNMMHFEKIQEILNWIIEIYDEFELEIYQENEIISLPQRNIIKLLSDKELLWKKSLRCTWITACVTIANPLESLQID
jgi:hypothetical protein